MGFDKSANKPTITCSENGPYLVNGLTEFTDSHGDAIPTDETKTLALCRCGGSKNKPFCDGTHAKIGFKGEKDSDRVADRRDTYIGKEITIHDNRGICAHAGICTDQLASVWRMKTEPWIDPQGADVEAIIDTIRACPSGALSYSIGDAEHRDQDCGPAMQLEKNGPYRVVGGVKIKGVAFGEGASQEHYTLCRCGGSKNKPFCDGSHWNIGFEDG